jgi:hypothetical protein
LWWLGSVFGGAAVAYGLLALASLTGSPYGDVVFVAAPLIHGASVSYPLAKSKLLGWPETFAAVFASCVVLFGFVFLYEGEGMVCALIASPIWFGVALVGMFFGRAITEMKYGTPVLVCVLPVVLVTTFRIDATHQPATRLADTFIVIDAPPERVWPLLFNLSLTEPPNTWYFRMGVACPSGTKTDTETNIRTCILSTGEMPERIVRSRKYESLEWAVVTTPPTMKEWNPFGGPEPKHLTESFRVLRGGFELQRLEGGKTRLRGWTEYESDVAPDVYWNLWNKTFVRGVQFRVMTEISRQATGST